MNQELIDEAVEDIKNYYFASAWGEVVEYFGENASAELDLLAGFEYSDVYAKGDVKECEIFYKLAAMQRALVYNLFNVHEDTEAMRTCCTLEYWLNKLFDKATGAENHNLWLH